jgi:hypothetical protein
VVGLAEWEAAVNERAPRFTKLAALVTRSQSDPATGADDLHLAYDRKYDDRRLQAALGSAYRSPPPMDADYLARFVSSLRGG